MQKSGVRETKLRKHGESYKWQYEYHYDTIAQLIFEVIGHATWLKTKEFDGWAIHYSAVWSSLYNSDRSKTRKIVLFKVRRLLYEEIKGIETHPNFSNAAYLGYCLNVLGLEVGKKRDFRADEYIRYGKPSSPLHKRTILLWWNANTKLRPRFWLAPSRSTKTRSSL
jgi:hypothetical protein